jgi:hypothetical protein
VLNRCAGCYVAPRKCHGSILVGFQRGLRWHIEVAQVGVVYISAVKGRTVWLITQAARGAVYLKGKVRMRHAVTDGVTGLAKVLIAEEAISGVKMLVMLAVLTD